jgi:hypothetical protein
MLPRLDRVGRSKIVRLDDGGGGHAVTVRDHIYGVAAGNRDGGSPVPTPVASLARPGGGLRRHYASAFEISSKWMVVETSCVLTTTHCAKRD